MFANVCIRYKGKQYEYLHKIVLSDYIGALVTNKGNDIIYFTTSDEYVCYIMEIFTDKPNIKQITLVGEYDTDESEDTDDDHYKYGIGIEEKLNEIASSRISIGLINYTHWDCVGTKVCGCGCDALHDGIGSSVCEPYPYMSKHF